MIFNAAKGIWEEETVVTAELLGSVYYQRDMGWSPVAEREDGFQVWKVANNVMNNQVRTAKKGWSSLVDVV